MIYVIYTAYVCGGRTTTKRKHQERYIVSLASLGFEGALYLLLLFSQIDLKAHCISCFSWIHVQLKHWRT